MRPLSAMRRADTISTSRKLGRAAAPRVGSRAAEWRGTEAAHCTRAHPSQTQLLVDGTAVEIDGLAAPTRRAPAPNFPSQRARRRSQGSEEMKKRRGSR